jgi:integrase
MPLSDVKIRNAKPGAKPYKLADGEGMFLLVHPNGGKYWRLKYRFAGRERILALGVYPEVGIVEARERRAQARKALAAGNDPATIKKEARRLGIVKQEQNFEAIAREWHKQNQHKWSDRYSETVLYRFERYLFPTLGSRPVADIEAPEVLSTMRRVERSGALDLAQRLMQMCGQVFMYAIATGRADRNPVPDLRGSLKTPVRRHYASLSAADLPEFLQRLEAYDGAFQTKLALRLLVLTFVRTTELRGAQWAEVDFDKAEWRIPAKRMKMKEQHLVPLSNQALAVMRELQKQTGNLPLLFPNRHKDSECISENTMLYALYRMGYHSRTTGHGLGHISRLVLHERRSTSVFVAFGAASCPSHC